MASFNFEPQRIYSTKTGEVLPLGESEIAAAILAGQAGYPKGSEIPMVNPNGEKVAVPAEEVGSALTSGFTLEPFSSQKARAEKQYYQSPTEQIKAGVEATARGATLGVFDLLATGVGLVDKEDAAKRKEYNPEAAIGGEVVGTIAPALLTGGTSLAAKGAAMAPSALVSKLSAKLAEETTKQIAKKGASSLAKDIAGKTVAASLASAVEGAVYGAGGTLTEAALGDPEKAAESLAANIGLGALVGGAFGGAAKLTGEGLAKGKTKLDEVLTKFHIDDEAVAGTMIGAVTGTSPKVNAAYLRKGGLTPDNLEKIGVNAEKFNEKIGAIGDQAADDLEKLKGAVTDAKDSLKAEHQNLVLQLKSAGEATKDAKEKAALTLKEAIDTRIQNLKDESVEPIVSDFVTALEDAQQKLFEGSEQATLKLAESDLAVPFRKLQQIKDKIVKDLPINPESEKAKRLLENQLSLIEGAFQAEPGTMLRGPALQKIKKDVDAFFKGNFGNVTDAKIAEYGDTAIDALKAFRNGLAEVLSQDAGYEAAMKPVREYAKLLSEMSKKAKIKDLVSAKRFVEAFKDDVHAKQYMPIVERIDSILGKNLKDQIIGYQDNKKILANEKLKDEFLRKEFPSLFQTVAEAEKAHTEAAALLKDQKSAMKRLSEYTHWQQTQAAYEAALNLSKTTKGLSTDSAQRFISEALSGKNKAKTEQLTAILKRIGVTDTAAAMDDMRFMRQLSVENVTNGSKHVNLYGALLGMGAGAVLGDEESGAMSALLGLGGGAGLGAIVDKTGPKLAKKMLDTYIKLRNVERIRQETTRAISSGIRSFIKDKTPISTGVKAGSVYYLLQNKFDSAQRERSKKDKYSMFEKRMLELGRAIGNDQFAMDNIMQSVQSLSDVAPKTSENLANKTLLAAKFLYSKAPQNPYAGYSLFHGARKWHPSDLELAKFERYAQAVDNPVSVIKDMEQGVMTYEGVETLRAVYPALYSEIVETVIEQVTEHGEDIPYSKKNQLSLLLGQPLDPTMSPEFIASMQTTPVIDAESERQALNKEIKPFTLSNIETEAQRIAGA